MDLPDRYAAWGAAIPRDLRHALIVLLITLWAAEATLPGDVHAMRDQVIAALADPRTAGRDPSS